MKKHFLSAFFTLIFTLVCAQSFAQTVAVFEFDCCNRARKLGKILHIE